MGVTSEGGEMAGDSGIRAVAEIGRRALLLAAPAAWLAAVFGRASPPVPPVEGGLWGRSIVEMAGPFQRQRSAELLAMLDQIREARTGITAFDIVEYWPGDRDA